jgi:hypothetical protein
VHAGGILAACTTTTDSLCAPGIVVNVGSLPYTSFDASLEETDDWTMWVPAETMEEIKTLTALWVAAGKPLCYYIDSECTAEEAALEDALDDAVDNAVVPTGCGGDVNGDIEDDYFEYGINIYFADVYYVQPKGATDRTIRVDTCGSVLDTLVLVTVADSATVPTYAGCDMDGATDNLCGGESRYDSTVTFTAEAGVGYFVSVRAYSSWSPTYTRSPRTGNYTLNIEDVTGEPYGMVAVRSLPYTIGAHLGRDDWTPMWAPAEAMETIKNLTQLLRMAAYNNMDDDAKAALEEALAAAVASVHAAVAATGYDCPASDFNIYFADMYYIPPTGGAADRTISVDTCGSDLNTTITVSKADSATNPTFVECDVDGATDFLCGGESGGDSALTFAAEAGAGYFVAVRHYKSVKVYYGNVDTSEGNYTLNIKEVV